MATDLHSVMLPLPPHTTVADTTTSTTPRTKDGGMTPSEYVSQERFTRILEGSPTHNGVSFADVGDPSGTPVVVLGGSGMSRLLPAAMCDGYCRDRGIRLIVPDKPGMGKTPPCSLAKRVETYADIVEAVVLHLGVGPVSLISMSSGFIYALYILIHKRSILDPNCPSLHAISPWVPTNISGSLSYLRAVPDSFVSNVHVLISMLNSPAISQALSWSSGVFSLTKSAVGYRKQAPPKDQLSVGRNYVSKEAIELSFKMTMQTEQFQGIGQDFLLCLRRGLGGKNWGYDNYQEAVKTIAKLQRQTWVMSGEEGAAAEENIGTVGADQTTKPKAFIRAYFGEKDSLVPKKAQIYLRALFDSPTSSVDNGKEQPRKAQRRKTSESANAQSSSDLIREAIDFDCVTIPGAGHDNVVDMECVLGKACADIRKKAGVFDKTGEQSQV